MDLTSVRSKTAQNQLVAFLVFILIVATGWLLVWPEFGKRKEAKAVLDVKVTELSEKRGLLMNIDKLISAHGGSAQEVTQLRQAIPLSPSIPQLLSGVENIVHAVGLRVASFQITELTEDEVVPAPEDASTPAVPEVSSQVEIPKLVTLQINLVVTGTPDGFLSLLSELERSLRLLDVRIINIESDEDDVPKEYELVIETYYQAQD